MIVDDCISRMQSAIELMRQEHERIKGSFRIQMEERRRRIKMQVSCVMQPSTSHQVTSQFSTETKQESKGSTMVNSRDPSNSMSPQILNYEFNQSNKRVDTLNQIVEEGPEQQFSFEEIKLKGENPFNKFKSPNTGWVTKSRQQESVNLFDFEPDCGSFQDAEAEDDS